MAEIICALCLQPTPRFDLLRVGGRNVPVHKDGEGCKS